jgi:hypothetical protein
MARLEFALAVAVGGVVLTLALNQLTQLQSLGHEARDQTVAAQRRAASAIVQARCGFEPPPASPADLAASPRTASPPDPCPQPDSTFRTTP